MRLVVLSARVCPSFRVSVVTSLGGDMHSYERLRPNNNVGTTMIQEV